MEHNAHHALPGIPFYRLKTAQTLLRDRIGAIRTTFLTPGNYLRSVRACKLYDYDRNQWTDFDGRPTGPRLARDRGAGVQAAE
jgi:omega-6 fatty acid desaturase (delta-12 desaturase)